MGNECVVVWDDSILEYDLGGNHPLDPIRLDLTMRLARALGLFDGVHVIPPRVASDEELLLVHTAAYLEAVREAPSGISSVGGVGPLGHGLGTEDNPIFDRMHEASALIAGGSVVAAEQIVSGRANRAVNIGGGLHHAMAERAAGFCVYNDCSIAIEWMLNNGVERVAYIDVDVHHGDGVQAAFYDDPRVLTVSLHQHPHTLWPGTGFAGETGGRGAEGSAVNLALPPGTGDAEWLRAFHAVVPSLLDSFRPQVLVTQCGADAHREDPLADLSVSVDGQRATYRSLRTVAEQYADGKWLALGGGGYSLFRVVPRAWTHLFATVLDRDLDPFSSVPGDWLGYAVQVASNVPIPTVLTDERPVDFSPWKGVAEFPVDVAIRDARHAVFPLHALDPNDTRD